MLNGQRHHLVQVEDLQSLVNHIFVPHSADFSQTTQSFFLIWLTPLSSKEFGHKILADLPNNSFEVITGLLLLTNREEAFAIRVKGELKD